jgi:hypothetical protein
MFARLERRRLVVSHGTALGGAVGLDLVYIGRLSAPGDLSRDLHIGVLDKSFCRICTHTRGSTICEGILNR